MATVVALITGRAAQRLVNRAAAPAHTAHPLR
jgi:hypothetical protein